MRHSIAWPRSSMSSCLTVSGSPAAARMPSRTMSMPVVISVTQCSTWTRVFISRKKYSPSCSMPSIVPAPTSSTALAASVPILPIRARIASSTAGAGDSSMSFWWRRWTEQSRSPRWMVLPWRAARTWSSTPAGRGGGGAGQAGGAGEVALEVDGRVGEELLALARGALEGRLQLVGRERDAEALAAAAARRLDRDRVADLLGRRAGRRERLHGLGGPGHDRHAGGLHQLARAGLRAHRLDR